MKKRNAILIENILSLLLFQGINYIFPIITLPFLVRTLGTETYGLYSFIFSFINYFVVFVDYGFNLTATREISVNRENPEKVSLIFCTVTLVKVILMLIGLVILVLLILFVDIFKENNTLYLASFLSVVGSVFYPVWFFQGVERMKTLVLINTVSKIIFTAALFIFISKSTDLILVVLFQSLAVVISGLAGLFIILRSYNIVFKTPSIKLLKEQIVNGVNVFVTIFSSTIFSNGNIFLLGILTDNVTVGHFAIADKIIRVFINITAPISTAIFPRVSHLYKQSTESALAFLKKIAFSVSAVIILICILLLCNADILVHLITNENIPEIGFLIRIMTFLPLTIFLDNIFGTQILINIGKSKQFMLSVLIPGMISILFSIILIPIYKSLASAMIVIFSEAFVLFLMMWFVSKSNIHIFEK
jgi:PST family polysaccharide transporter